VSVKRRDDQVIADKLRLNAHPFEKCCQARLSDGDGKARKSRKACQDWTVVDRGALSGNFSRRPTPAETSLLAQFIAHDPDPRQGLRDALPWQVGSSSSEGCWGVHSWGDVLD
jgi:hypothetical protein